MTYRREKQLPTFDAAKAPCRSVGMVWEFSEEHQDWSRYLLRRYRDGSHYWMELHFVDHDDDFCLYCFSSTLKPYYDDPTLLHCLNCGSEFHAR